jgi:hypothetical protein
MRYGPNIVTNGLVLSLDAADKNSYVSGSQLWYDLSGNNYNGTLNPTNNGPTFDSTKGGCINFDGTDDYASLGNVLTYTTSNFSFCMWFNLNSLTNGRLFNKGTNYRYSVNSSGNFIYDYSYSGGSVNLQLPASITTNKWYFIVSSRNGTSHTFRIYKPDSSVFTYTLTNHQNPSSNSDDFLLSTDSSIYSNIKIACLLNYNINLSNAEILQNFNATKARFGLT